MVGQWPLKPLIGVRIPVPEHIEKSTYTLDEYANWRPKLFVATKRLTEKSCLEMTKLPYNYAGYFLYPDKIQDFRDL